MINIDLLLTIGISLITLICLVFILKQSIKQQTLLTLLREQSDKIYEQQKTQQHSLEKALTEQYHQLQHKLSEIQITQMKNIQDSVLKSMQDIRHQIQITLTDNAQVLRTSVTELTQQTKQQLTEISGHVDKKLTEGFEKTSETFTRIVERLTMIDAAQKKITELSTNVVSLQEILNDKRARGAFGEVQLSGLLHNVLPAESFQMQHTLSNGKRVDCLLLLPKPTGNVAIDAKFPLENYRKLSDINLDANTRKEAEQCFKQDIRKHIKDISEKYIIEGETADGAILFLPSESIFADLHAHYPDIVAFAQQARVWLSSPTTMMAILTTARSVLKDVATRKQVHIIQEHLGMLSKDFSRFEDRMEKLAKHIQQANQDVGEVQTSARKISNRFTRIEQVDLNEEIVLLDTAE